ncbi:ABC transporter permease [Chitinilyticum litopenaei]|uniref:ABC transporter permease n=1 Tax=Chitinilyticum litopenaei TaxID=1121276 RepID=UPI00048E1A80|nr:ABC transporter permease [Chitinilyticum litopenaei]
MGLLERLWGARWLFQALVSRELKARYSGSMLGWLWLFLPAIVLIFTYSVIFADLMKSRLPGVQTTYGYTVYLTSGMVMWQFMSELILRGKQYLVDNANLLKKNGVSKIIPLLAVAAVAAFNASVMALIFWGFLLLIGEFNLLIVPVYFLQLVVAAGWIFPLAGILALLNANVRDVGQFVDSAMQILFWATPIVYSVAIVPASIREIFQLNPFLWLIEPGRAVLLGHEIPWFAFVKALLLGIILFAIFVPFYRRNIQKVMDEL